MDLRPLILLALLGCAPSPSASGAVDAPATDSRAAASEPCVFVERLRAVAGDLDPERDLDAAGSAAFRLLASAPDGRTGYFVWGDGAGAMSEPSERIRAIWALWGGESAARAFAALYLASDTGSTGQFAALIGLRHRAPAAFEDAARHFEHTGAHFLLFQFPSDMMCGAPWQENRPDGLREYVDALRLAEFELRWEAQIAVSNR